MKLANREVYFSRHQFLLDLGRIYPWTSLWDYRGHIVILVAVENFSKGFHLGMLQPHYFAHAVALLFMDIVKKIHGMPRSLVSDHDPLFINRF